MIHWRAEGEIHKQGINVTAISIKGAGMSIGVSLRISKLFIIKRWRSWTFDIPLKMEYRSWNIIETDKDLKGVPELTYDYNAENDDVSITDLINEVFNK